MPRAAGLADELKQRFGYDSQLIKGSGGVFEVTLDGKLLFSKKQTGRFPNPGEVAAALSEALA